MAQLPLIIIGRIKLFRDYPALGNVGLSAFVSTLHQRLMRSSGVQQLFFWIGLLSGFPLLAVWYVSLFLSLKFASAFLKANSSRFSSSSYIRY